jgi:ankyrin repeat protein
MGSIKRLSACKQRARSTKFRESSGVLNTINTSEMVALALESRGLYAQAEELYRSMISVCQNVIRSEGPGATSSQRPFIEKLWKLVTRLVAILEENHRVEGAIEVLEDFATRLILPDGCPGERYGKEVIFHLLRLYPELATLCGDLYSTTHGFSLHRALEVQWPALVGAILDDIPKDSVSLKDRNPEGETALHVIAKMEHGGSEAPFLSATEKLLDLGADLEATDNSGRSPLFLAAELGAASIVRLFLERSANSVAAPARIKTDRPATSQPQDLRLRPPTPLHAAIFKSHEAIALLMLSYISDIGRLEYPAAALVYACEKGLYGVVSQLLDKGLDINACHMVKRKVNQRTLLLSCPLTLAVFGGHKEVAQLLLARGVGLKAKEGCNAVWVAVETEHEELLELLLEHDSTLFDSYNCGCFEHRSSRSGNLRESLPEESPLQQACRRGWLRGTQMLLDKGADPNQLAKQPEDEITWGTTALTAACRGGHEPVVQILMRAGADVNAPPAENDRRTALQASCEGGHESIVELLLQAGADVNAPPVEHDGRTALQAACENGHLSIVEILLRAGADVSAPPAQVLGCTALQAACGAGFTSIIETLLRVGADVNASPAEEHGRTALQAACEGVHASESIVEILLRAGADVNAPAADYGLTALQAACEGGHTSIVDILLRAGADVNASPAEHEGRTALQAACSGGYTSIVEKLLRARADVNAPAAEEFGCTALQAACERGHESIVEILLRAGADVNAPATGPFGRTALQHGRKHPKTNITQLLLEAGAI